MSCLCEHIADTLKPSSSHSKNFSGGTSVTNFKMPCETLLKPISKSPNVHFSHSSAATSSSVVCLQYATPKPMLNIWKKKKFFFSKNKERCFKTTFVTLPQVHKRERCLQSVTVASNKIYRETHHFGDFPLHWNFCFPQSFSKFKNCLCANSVCMYKNTFSISQKPVNFSMSKVRFVN